jgi:hypothetical protein
VSAMTARRFRGRGHYLRTLKASPCPWKSISKCPRLSD